MLLITIRSFVCSPTHPSSLISLEARDTVQYHYYITQTVCFSMGAKQTKENVFDPSKVKLQPSSQAGVYQRRGIASHAPKIGSAQQVVEMQGPLQKQVGKKCYPSHLEGSIHILPIDMAQFIDLPIRTTPRPPGFEPARNRWANVFPSTVNQVLITPENPTYLNASWIRGQRSSSGCEYIAAEVPVEGVVNDFHQLIFSQKIAFLVLILDSFELKETQYWPKEEEEKGKVYGDLRITSSNVLSREATRKIALHYENRRGMKHTATLFIYTGWPSNSVPCTKDGHLLPRPLLELMLTVRADRNQYDRRQSPLLVHCMDGISRTGAFVAVDHAMDCIENGAAVDVIDIVQQLREDRLGMVNSTTLYRLIHEAALQFGFYHMSVHTETPGIIYSLPRPQKGKDVIPPENTCRFVKHKLETDQVVFVLDDINAATLEAFDRSDQVLFTPLAFSSKSDLEECDFSKFPMDQQAYHKTNFSQAQVKSLLRQCRDSTFVAACPKKDSNKYILGVKAFGEAHQTALRLSKMQNGNVIFVLEQGSHQFESMEVAANHFSKRITDEHEELQQQYHQPQQQQQQQHQPQQHHQPQSSSSINLIPNTLSIEEEGDDTEI
eukprot:m.136833 g.136833  ORF g.136833 m.136833 type:complete len:607 (-) comp10999_c0_seq1:1781-3601(-)